MVHTHLKPKEEILDLVDGVNSIFVIRCMQCAGLCGTGRYKTFMSIKDMLEENGLTVTSDGDNSKVNAPCFLDDVLKKIEEEKTIIGESDALGMLCCGAGVMSATRVINEYAKGQKVIPFCDTVGVGIFGKEIPTGEKTVLCSACSRCVLGITEGVCPQALCTKSLRKPCKKIEDLTPTCEYDETNSCVFYELSQKGLLEGMLAFDKE